MRIGGIKEPQTEPARLSTEQRVPGLGQAILLTLFGLYFLTVGRLAVDFPYWDDYHAVLETVCKFQSAHTGAERISTLMAQHNEHRIVFARSVAVGAYALQGRVDFRTLIWLGNLGLVALCLAVHFGARRTIPWASVGLLFPVALLSPIHGKQMIWAMASLSNFWSLAFAAGSLALLTRGQVLWFGLACVLAELASFTSGQGLFCFGAGVVALAIQRRWKASAMWLVLMALTAAAYFHGYAKPAHHPSPTFTWETVQFFPTLVGSALSEFALRFLAPLLEILGLGAWFTATLQAGVGLGLIGASVWLWAKGYYRRNLFLAIFLVFLLALCAAASISRSGFGLEQALTPRYRVWSASIAAIVVMALLDLRYSREDRTFPNAAILLGGVQFALLAWCLFYPDVKAFSTELRTCQERFVRSQDPRSVRFGSYADLGLDLLWRSYLSGLRPLHDLGTGNTPLISPKRLARIATTNAEMTAGTAPVIAPNQARLVAQLEWAGENLRLLPVMQKNGNSHGTGMAWLTQGEIHYLLPQMPPNP